MKNKYYVSYQPNAGINNAIFNITVEIEGPVTPETVLSAVKNQGPWAPKIIAWSKIEEESIPLSREEKLKRAAEAASKDKESATKFLQGAGIMDENGHLAEQYNYENEL
jgi:hypothetical protein